MRPCTPVSDSEVDERHAGELRRNRCRSAPGTSSKTLLQLAQARPAPVVPALPGRVVRIERNPRAPRRTCPPGSRRWRHADRGGRQRTGHDAPTQLAGSIRSRKKLGPSVDLLRGGGTHGSAEQSSRSRPRRMSGRGGSVEALARSHAQDPDAVRHLPQQQEDVPLVGGAEQLEGLTPQPGLRTRERARNCRTAARACESSSNASGMASPLTVVVPNSTTRNRRTRTRPSRHAKGGGVKPTPDVTRSASWLQEVGGQRAAIHHRAPGTQHAGAFPHRAVRSSTWLSMSRHQTRVHDDSSEILGLAGKGHALVETASGGAPELRFWSNGSTR